MPEALNCLATAPACAPDHSADVVTALLKADVVASALAWPRLFQHGKQLTIEAF